MELVREEIAGGGRAALVAIHDLDAAARYADRILIMNLGRIAAEGLEGPHVAEIFGVEHAGGEWRPVERTSDG
jgi:iron complex transport system ATP-binding protein